MPSAKSYIESARYACLRALAMAHHAEGRGAPPSVARAIAALGEAADALDELLVGKETSR